MFKLIVLGFAILGTNGQPVILNEQPERDLQRYGYEQNFFKTEEGCKEQGQAYVDAFAGSDIRVTFFLR